MKSRVSYPAFLQYKMIMRLLLVSFLLMTGLQTVAMPALNPGKPDPADDASTGHEFDLGLEYGTTRLYRGIKSSSNPYLKPSFTYYAASGFYAGVAGYFSLDSGLVDETDLNVGYEFLQAENTRASLEFTHYFFRNNKLANSEIKNELELYLHHDFGSVFNSKLYLDADFGNGSTDYSATLENGFDFLLYDAEDASLIMRPAFGLTAGTLNLVKKVKKDVISSGFRLTNYDLSLSLEYNTGRFSIEPCAAYDFPVHEKGPLKKATKGDPTFDFTITATYVLN
jgi:hypothetical protein